MAGPVCIPTGYESSFLLLSPLQQLVLSVIWILAIWMLFSRFLVPCLWSVPAGVPFFGSVFLFVIWVRFRWGGASKVTRLRVWKCTVINSLLMFSTSRDRFYASYPILFPSKWVKSLRHVWLFATLWTVAYQAPLSMGFSRQEYWSGLPFPSPGDLPDSGMEPRSPALQTDAFPSKANKMLMI